MRYRNREDAGERLAAALAEYSVEHTGERPLVLGVARGGVPVAAVVADRLGGELDVAVARKLGAPGNPELAVGAVTVGGEQFVDEVLLHRLGVPLEYVQREAATQSAEVERRVRAYRAGELPDPAGRTTIVVDDGIATGATVFVVARWARARGAAKVVVAVPVGPADSLHRLAGVADEVVCPLQPHAFFAVGEWYEDFAQTPDAVVEALLRTRSGPTPG